MAADLLSQAEHGPDSQVVLVTPSRELAEATAKAVAAQLSELPRREIAEKALSASRLILVKDLEECVEVSNRYAPEHLIIQTRNARELVPLVQNAGSVFVGDWSPSRAATTPPARTTCCRPTAMRPLIQALACRLHEAHDRSGNDAAGL